MRAGTLVALAVLIVIGGGALVAPWLSPWSHDTLDWRHLAAAPFTESHWLGTDRLGRDLFARSMQALRVSLSLGVQEPFASLGSLINEGAQEMESSPWMLLVPATLLTALLVALNLLGERLRTAREARRG